MQGQVTFLNQNGLIPFGIANPKSKRQKTRCFDGKVFTVFSKNVFLSTVANFNCTGGNLRIDTQTDR